MAPPQVTIYVTSLTSTPKVRSHIELLHRGLRGLEIPYETFDLVNDPEAKTRWQRAKPSGQVIGLPGYLVGGEWVGTMDDFEEAVETATLPHFLKQDIDVDPSASGGLQQTELENLMRGMSAADLDKLAGELGPGPEVGKVGLLVPEGEQPVPAAAPTGESAPKTETVTATNVISEPLSSFGSADASIPPSAHDTAEDAASTLPDEEAKKTRERDSLGMTKEEMAEAMQKADTVEGLMALTERAESKEKVD